MRNILITGATGFIGGYLTDLLIARGFAPRLLVRRQTTDLERFTRTGASLFIGEWSNQSFLRKAMEGCDTIIHVAGATKRLTRRDYFRDNLDFTEALLAATPEETRFVFISSQAAAGPSSPDRPVTEEDAPRPLTWYGASKLAAEEAVKRWGEIHHNNYVILRPCSVFGPGERDIFTYFFLMDRGILLLLGDGTKQFSIIYVADLCEAIVTAAESTISGRTFFVANDEPISWRSFAEEVRRAMGKERILRIPIPEGVATPIGYLTDFVGRLTGKALPVNKQKIIEMKQPAWLCSNRALRSATGWQPRWTLDNALTETVSWYRRHGWLRS